APDYPVVGHISNLVGESSIVHQDIVLGDDLTDVVSTIDRFLIKTHKQYEGNLDLPTIDCVVADSLVR
ncbi:hypothetical protein A2U01_0086307, partial [Trifolium medium]|nr:hypothetical protein [Trifolium medium]